MIPLSCPLVDSSEREEVSLQFILWGKARKMLSALIRVRALEEGVYLLDNLFVHHTTPTPFALTPTFELRRQTPNGRHDTTLPCVNVCRRMKEHKLLRIFSPGPVLCVGTFSTERAQPRNSKLLNDATTYRILSSDPTRNIDRSTRTAIFPTRKHCAIICVSVIKILAIPRFILFHSVEY